MHLRCKMVLPHFQTHTGLISRMRRDQLIPEQGRLRGLAPVADYNGWYNKQRKQSQHCLQYQAERPLTRFLASFFMITLSTSNHKHRCILSLLSRPLLTRIQCIAIKQCGNPTAQSFARPWLRKLRISWRMVI